MANSNSPFGLRPVRSMSGAPLQGAIHSYWAPASYGTALYIGDPVVANGDSNDSEIMGFIPGSLPEVVLATAGDGAAITGVVVGFANSTRDSTVYGAASTDRIVLAIDYNNIVFHIRDDGGGTPSVDWVNWNANLIAGAGSTVTGLSGWALDGGTSDGPDADASNQLFIRALAPILDNEMGDYAIWEVLINQNQYAPANGLGIA